MSIKQRALCLAVSSFFSFSAYAADMPEVNPQYQQAVNDAAIVTRAEISQDLKPISAANTRLVWNEDKSRILVVTWKAQGAYESFLKPYDKTSNNPEYAVWVTAAPQVQSFCQNYVKNTADMNADKLNLRLKQYLGLNDTWEYDVFVEMWVEPANMFRPCVDPEIDDNTCNLNFGKEIPKVRNIPDYQEFYSDLYFKSFRASGGVPWTGLGYTYDWGNAETEVGASEYILTPETSYQIERVLSTTDYCGLK